MAVDIRVLSWNVHGLRDDRFELARVVRDLDPDVMCVQEAPKYLRWRSKCAALARECGLLYVTGGGTTGGTALMVHLRVHVESSAELALSRRVGWPTRGVAASVLRVGGARLTVASLHLPLQEWERPHHVRRALELARKGGSAPVVVAGDLNERPGRPAWTALQDAGLRDLGPGSGHTFPAGAPNRRIDAVFATENVEVLHHRVLDSPGVELASDHLPVVVDMRVSANAD